MVPADKCIVVEAGADALEAGQHKFHVVTPQPPPQVFTHGAPAVHRSEVQDAQLPAGCKMVDGRVEVGLSIGNQADALGKEDGILLLAEAPGGWRRCRR